MHTFSVTASAFFRVATAMLLVGCVDVILLDRPHDVGVTRDEGTSPDVGLDHDDLDVSIGDTGEGRDTAFPPDLGDLPAVLRADPGPHISADIGASVVLDGRASTGAAAFLWTFGDGRGWDEPGDEARAIITYEAPGRYQATLTVYDETGRTDVASKIVTITQPVVHAPVQSSTVTTFGARAAVVSPDSNELLIVEVDGETVEVVERLPTDREPRAVTPWFGGEWVVVTCREDATVLYMRTNRTGEQRRVFLPVAAQPYGAVASAGKVYVTLQATGELIEIEERLGVPTVSRSIDAIEDARDLAVLPDGRFLVSRWRSPDAAAQLAIVSADLDDVQIMTLAIDASDMASGGIPSYLGAAAVSPTGLEAVVPSLQANIARGLTRNGSPLTHDTTLRAAASFIDLGTGIEQLARRKLWDNRGFANAAIFSPRGDYLYVSMRGNQAIDRFDMLDGVDAGSISGIGYAIEGLALSGDGRWLFVDAAASRELVVFDAHRIDETTTPVARITIPTSDPLDAELLRGKQLFNDAQDPRLSADGYIACAHCHLDGGSDGRVWDLTDRGEGLRNTIALTGRGGSGDGPLHWSAGFDEVQDVEHYLRDAFGGLGLLSDAELAVGSRAEPLGDPKAGVSGDLDALAAYVTSLDRHARSPFRRATGELTVAAAAGRVVFEAQGCATCHLEPRFTDSAFTMPGVPLLHDVGTLGPGSGMRLGAPLVGLDTPTLRGLWETPPYLHDGSAATVEEVLTVRNTADLHGVTSTLDATQIANLAEYLLSLDYR